MIRITTTVFCNVCGVWMDREGHSAKPMVRFVRREAKSRGWLTAIRTIPDDELQDYCPRCQQEAGEERA